MVGDIVINTRTWKNTLTSALSCTQKFMYNSRAQLNAWLLWIPWKSGISSDQTCKLGVPHSLLQTAVLQIKFYKARSKSGKQVRQGAAWMTACETLLLETGSAPALPFLWCFPFRFGSTLYVYLFWRFFFLWTVRSCFTGKQSHGSTSKSTICSSSIQSSGLSLHLLQTPRTHSNPLWAQSPLTAMGFPVSLSIRGFIRASLTSAREGNYLETYVAIAT